MHGACRSLCVSSGLLVLSMLHRFWLFYGVLVSRQIIFVYETCKSCCFNQKIIMERAREELHKEALAQKAAKDNMIREKCPALPDTSSMDEGSLSVSVTVTFVSS